jgi:hypothetical protein
MGIGIILYLIKNAKLKKEGIDVKATMRKIPESVTIDD